MEPIKVVKIEFDNEILPAQVTLFRGAVNSLLGKERSDLYHNHLKGGLRYSYPLIQYKRLNKRAAIVCIDEGTEAINEFLNTGAKHIVLGDRPMELTIGKITAEKFNVEVGHFRTRYHMHNWLPLNKDNYTKYSTLESIVDRAALLNRVLTGNILSFLKGIGLFVETTLDCRITSIEKTHMVTYKGEKLMALDVVFSRTITLPLSIGLGKGARVGFGTITNKKS